MTNWFLKWKPWQLFVVTAAPPILYIFILLYSLFIEEKIFSPQEFWVENTLLHFVLFISGGIFYTWIWFTVKFLFKFLSLDLIRSYRLFKILHLYSALYFTVLLLSLIFGLIDFDYEDIPSTFFLFFHFVAMFSLLHSTYFASKIIRTGELGRKVLFSDFSSYFYNMSCFHIFTTSNYHLKVQKIVEKKTGLDKSQHMN